MRLKARLTHDVLPPIAGGATMAAYYEALAKIPDEHAELRREVDSLVTQWLTVSKSPDLDIRQQTVESISEQLDQLMAGHPSYENPIRTIHRYMIEEYREEAKVGQPSNIETLLQEKPDRETKHPKREPPPNTTFPSTSLPPPSLCGRRRFTNYIGGSSWSSKSAGIRPEKSGAARRNKLRNVKAKCNTAYGHRSTWSAY